LGLTFAWRRSLEFNAWQHQRLDPPWWPLLNAIYLQSRKQVRVEEAKATCSVDHRLPALKGSADSRGQK
jgi:hypothetical protein